MGCGSSHSLPVTPEYGDHKERSLLRSPSTNARLSVQEDVFLRDGGEGGNEVRDGDEAKPLETEQINNQYEEEGRTYDGHHEEDDRPKSDGQRINGILTDRRGLKEVSSPRNSSGRSKNLAFEVPALDNGGGDSLIKRHPPKKFQKLEEQLSDANITQELLEEKQAIAEKRRKEILSQRVKSAKTTSAKSVQARARVAENKEVDQ
ncbi:Protein of unknown function DUF4619, partial [Trinorchestia longiramus]